MKGKVILVFLSLLAMAGGLYLSVMHNRPEPIKITGLLPEGKPLKDFILVDQHDQTVTRDSFKGVWSIVAMGFTHCPDVCPAILTKFKQMNKLLQEFHPKLAQDTRFVFVSVDPDRDTPAVLKEYLAYFDPTFVGLTGDHRNLMKFTSSVFASYIIPNSSEENYAVGHSAALHLIDEMGEIHGIIRSPYTAEGVVENYVKIRKYLEK